MRLDEAVMTHIVRAVCTDPNSKPSTFGGLAQPESAP
jgi:hypothetical protein